MTRQQRLYSLNGEGLKPLHDRVSTFERYWDKRLDRLAEYLDELQSGEEPDERDA